MRKLLFPIFIAIIALSSWSFTYKSDMDKVQWYTWEQAQELSKKNKKKILVFIYTEKCNWCKMMENSTFDDDYVVNYIANNFYPVKFDAQYKDPITYKGEEYQYVTKNGVGYHEFAAALTGGKLYFPMSVFLDEDGKVLQSIQGYKPTEVFEMILTFYGEDYHKKKPWDQHTKNYNRLQIVKKKEKKNKPIYIAD